MRKEIGRAELALELRRPGFRLPLWAGGASRAGSRAIGLGQPEAAAEKEWPSDRNSTRHLSRSLGCRLRERVGHGLSRAAETKSQPRLRDQDIPGRASPSLFGAPASMYQVRVACLLLRQRVEGVGRH